MWIVKEIDMGVAHDGDFKNSLIKAYLTKNIDSLVENIEFLYYLDDTTVIGANDVGKTNETLIIGMRCEE